MEGGDWDWELGVAWGGGGVFLRLGPPCSVTLVTWLALLQPIPQL